MSKKRRGSGPSEAAKLTRDRYRNKWSNRFNFAKSNIISNIQVPNTNQINQSWLTLPNPSEDVLVNKELLIKPIIDWFNHNKLNVDIERFTDIFISINTILGVRNLEDYHNVVKSFVPFIDLYYNNKTPFNTDLNKNLRIETLEYGYLGNLSIKGRVITWGHVIELLIESYYEHSIKYYATTSTVYSNKALVSLRRVYSKLLHKELRTLYAKTNHVVTNEFHYCKYLYNHSSEELLNIYIIAIYILSLKIQNNNGKLIFIDFLRTLGEIFYTTSSKYIDDLRDQAIVGYENIPMICPPNPWVNSYHGGFLSNNNNNIIHHTPTAQHCTYVSDEYLNAVNNLNKIQFKINIEFLNFLCTELGA
uniref:Orf361 n=1 Tax=Spizellomyces punctatus TaxID=109760 RepID=Q950R7_SPIPN|nr:orf361 [Spizellomyces punctatus]AAK84241.1 orf361 [Spizellomyces punctatus]